MILARHFARFGSGLQFEHLPETVRRKVVDLVADWLANAAAGIDSPIGRALYRLIRTGAGQDAAVIAGTLETTDFLSAALINGAACHHLEFDDAYSAGLYHPGAPVISAAWAAAGAAHASGRDFLTAIVAGYEISQRIARAVNPEHYGFWHTTGTVGALGAAAAAARCLDLDAEKSTWALGLSGTQAAGLWEVLPQAPLAKNLHPAKAAHAGILAALLAAEGIYGPDTILEGGRGFFAATVSKKVDPKACTAGLGQKWLILDTTIKAYPVCGHVMTSIEAALNIHQRLDPEVIKADVIKGDVIEEVEVRANPVSVRVAGNPKPQSPYQAKFSIPFCVALALSEGRVTQAAFCDEAFTHTGLVDLMSRIRVVADPEMAKVAAKRPAKVTVRLADGKTFEETATTRKGDPQRPLSDREKMEKFTTLTQPVWGAEVSQAIYPQINRLPQVKDMRRWWAELPRPDMKSKVFKKIRGQHEA